MRSIISKSIISIIAVIFSYLNALPQEKIYKGEVPAPVKKEDNILRKHQAQPQSSDQVIDFEKRMKAAKKSGNRDEIIRLQSESDRITGTHTDIPQQMIVKKLAPEETDNIVMNSIANSSERIIYGMATCTEQSGSTTGRIWSVYSYLLSYTPYYPDGIGIKYSDDNGTTWNNFGIYSFGGTQIIGNDAQMDAELIISSSNEKYLWITFTTSFLSLTHSRIGMFVADLNTGVVSNFVLNWPGGPSVHYKTPRIVSDVAQYPYATFMYIVASFDSLDNIGGVGMAQGEKVAICYNPYTTSPSITYRTSSFMRTFNLGVTGTTDYFNCDIAYFSNGSEDSIQLVETGLASNSTIALGVTSIFSYVSTSPYVAYEGTINISTPGTNKRSRGFIASNGGYNNLMVTVLNAYTANDHDVEYYHSTNGAQGWSQGFIDYSTNDVKTDAEVVGQINAPGEFAVAFANVFPSKVIYYQTDSYNWSAVYLNSYSHLLNHYNRIPKAGIRLNSGSENCFAIWSDTTKYGMWSSTGCTGPVQSFAKLTISAAIEGLYDPVMNTEVPDTARIYLRSSAPPYNVVDSSKGIITGPYSASFFIFSNTPYNVPYYIQVRHRNALESWSSVPISFSTYEKGYAFSGSQSSTYGNNAKLIDNDFLTIYGFYSGDVNQDGFINLNDIILTSNNAGNFVTGYVSTDLNGDNITNLNDLILTYNNSNMFLRKITP